MVSKVQGGTVGQGGDIGLCALHNVAEPAAGRGRPGPVASKELRREVGGFQAEAALGQTAAQGISVAVGRFVVWLFLRTPLM